MHISILKERKRQGKHLHLACTFLKDANGCGVNAIGTWTNLIKFWLILQHIGRPIEYVNARF